MHPFEIYLCDPHWLRPASPGGASPTARPVFLASVGEFPYTPVFLWPWNDWSYTVLLNSDQLAIAVLRTPHGNMGHVLGTLGPTRFLNPAQLPQRYQN